MEVCSHLQSCGSWDQTLAVSLTASTFKLLDLLKAGKQVFQNNEHLSFSFTLKYFLKNLKLKLRERERKRESALLENIFMDCCVTNYTADFAAS